MSAYFVGSEYLVFHWSIRRNTAMTDPRCPPHDDGPPAVSREGLLLAHLGIGVTEENVLPPPSGLHGDGEPYVPPEKTSVPVAEKSDPTGSARESDPDDIDRIADE